MNNDKSTQGPFRAASPAQTPPPVYRATNWGDMSDPKVAQAVKEACERPRYDIPTL